MNLKPTLIFVDDSTGHAYTWLQTNPGGGSLVCSPLYNDGHWDGEWGEVDAGEVYADDPQRAAYLLQLEHTLASMVAILRRQQEDLFFSISDREPTP